MLGRIPFVSTSDKRLGGMENSSLRYFSAMRALDVSMSRRVSQSFSRNVRRFFPAAGSMVSASSESGGHHIKPFSSCVHLCKCYYSGYLLRFPNLLLPLPCQATLSVSSTKAIAASAGLEAVNFLCVFVIRNKSGKSKSEPETQFSAFYSVFITTPTIAFPP